MDFLLTNLADELLVTDICERSAVLAALSDDELQAAYDHTLEQFALELLIGAHENSDWSNGKLVIDANHGPIHLLQTAFYAVKLETQLGRKPHPVPEHELQVLSRIFPLPRHPVHCPRNDFNRHAPSGPRTRVALSAILGPWRMISTLSGPTGTCFDMRRFVEAFTSS